MPEKQASLEKGTQGQINRLWREQKFKKEVYLCFNVCSKAFVYLKVKYIKNNSCAKTPDYSSDEPLQYLSDPYTTSRSEKYNSSELERECFRIFFPYLFKLREEI